MLRKSNRRFRGLELIPLSRWIWGYCQNYDPFLGPYYTTGPNTGPNLGDPKRDHNFDNPPHEVYGDHLISIYLRGTINPKPEFRGHLDLEGSQPHMY